MLASAQMKFVCCFVFEFSQFARGFQRLSDKVQSNRKYGQCIAFFAVCIVKISAVSSIVSIFDFMLVGRTQKSNNLYAIFCLSRHCRLHSLEQYEFFTERNCYSNSTFEGRTDGMHFNFERSIDDCDYNVAMNVSRIRPE